MNNVLILAGVLLVVIGFFGKRRDNEIEEFNKLKTDNLTSRTKTITASKEILISDSSEIKQDKNNPTEIKTNIIKDVAVKKESTTENKEEEKKIKGDKFEAYICEKFPKKYYDIIEWRSDKGTNGVYPKSSQNPDFVVEHKFTSKRFAVECKYFSDFYMHKINGKAVTIEEYQIKNYKKFKEKDNMNVFILLGVGGEPDSIGALYIVPIDKINEEKIFKNNYGKIILTELFLKTYKSQKKDNTLFYSPEKDDLYNYYKY